MNMTFLGGVRRVVAAIGFLSFALAGCANSIPELGKVADEQGQPVAGVHVLVWRWTTTRSIIPFGSSISSPLGDPPALPGRH